MCDLQMTTIRNTPLSLVFPDKIDLRAIRDTPPPVETSPSPFRETDNLKPLSPESQPNAVEHRASGNAAIAIRLESGAGDRREARTLARAFGLGRLRTKSTKTPFGFEHGTIRHDGNGYAVTRNRHPNPQFSGMRNVKVPVAISEEVLRRSVAGEEVGVWNDSRVGEVGYHGFMFAPKGGGKEVSMLYDHVLDRVVHDPYRAIEDAGREHNLGGMLAPRIEGGRNEAVYRRIFEFERGRVLIDRDIPDRLLIDVQAGGRG
jgi:hypothetical protein